MMQLGEFPTEQELKTMVAEVDQVNGQYNDDNEKNWDKNWDMLLKWIR